MKSDLLVSKRDIHRFKGTPMLLASILVGLVLAWCMLISPQVAVMVLLSGMLLALTVLLRKVDYLIIIWVVLTTFIWLIITRLPHYEALLGRAIFWGLLGCVVVAWAVDNILRRKQFTTFDNVPLIAIVVVFLIWGTMSLYAAQDVFLSVKKFSHVVIALVISYVFYDFFSRDFKNVKKLLKVVSLLFIGIASVTVVIGLESVISGVPIYKRISLWFWNPNTLGTFLFLGIPIVITVTSDFIQNKGFRALLIAIMFLGLMFSFHRSSWVAASVSVFFLVLKSRLRIPFWFVIVLGIFLAGVLFPAIGDDVYHYATGERYTGRKEIWKAALNAASDRPWLGTGPGTSTMNISRYIDTPWLKGEDTHSSYLKNAVEMGFASVAIMLAFYMTVLYYSNRIEMNLKSHYLVSVTRGVTATVLGLVVYDIFQNGFVMTSFDAAEFTVMWPYILVALPFAAKRLDERSTGTRRLQ